MNLTKGENMNNKEINNILLSRFGMEVFNLKDGQMQTDEPPFHGIQCMLGIWVEIDYDHFKDEDQKKRIFNKVKKVIPSAIYCDDDVFCFIPNQGGK
jgi:hypothetical protein